MVILTIPKKKEDVFMSNLTTEQTKALINDAVAGAFKSDTIKTLIKDSVIEAFHDVGIKVDTKDNINETRELFSFIKHFKRGVDTTTKTVGTAVIFSVTAAVIAAFALGAKIMLAVKATH